jgi:hypothetical protein
MGDMKPNPLDDSTGLDSMVSNEADFDGTDFDGTGLDSTALNPLTTDSQIQERVANLIGRANVRQLWLLFLDELDLQLPLLIPIDGLPALPSDEQTAEVIDRVREVMGEIGASSVIVVLERYAAANLTEQDRAWATSISRGCEASGVPLRAQLLSHRSGVRWIAADDL